MLLRRLCLACWVILLTLPLQASTYYVSPQGNDAANGQTQATAWRTLAKVNAATFAPDDLILFQRGGEWRESLLASSSGTAGHAIVYGDYGEGNKPKFWGSEMLESKRFTPAENGLYSYALATPPNAVLDNHSFLLNAGDKTLADMPHAYQWQAGTLKINTGGSDPRADGHSYTLCMREDAINSNGKSHLVFQNLVTDETAQKDGGYGVRIMGSEDVLVDGCEVWRAGKHHFASINSTGIIFRHCYAAWAMPGLGFGGQSAYVSFGDDTSPLNTQSSEYHDCTFDHVQDTQDGGDHYYFFVTHGSHIGSVLLENMVSRGAPCSLDNRESGATLQIRGGILTDNRLELYGSHILVDGLTMTGAQATIDLSASDSTLQNVVMTGTNLGNAWFQTAILSRAPHNSVHNCRIIMAPDAPDFNSCLATAEKSTDFDSRDNLLLSNGPALRNWMEAK